MEKEKEIEVQRLDGYQIFFSLFFFLLNIEVDWVDLHGMAHTIFDPYYGKKNGMSIPKVITPALCCRYIS